MRFLDTNVLVYTQADAEPRKQKIAQEIVSEDLNAGQIYRGMVVVNPFGADLKQSNA